MRHKILTYKLNSLCYLIQTIDASEAEKDPSPGKPGWLESTKGFAMIISYNNCSVSPQIILSTDTKLIKINLYNFDVQSKACQFHSVDFFKELCAFLILVFSRFWKL